jgi:hypothetical protein
MGCRPAVGAPDWPRGTYLPALDAYEQSAASLAEFALVTHAIHRFIAVKAEFQDGPDAWRMVRPGAAAAAPLRFARDGSSSNP